MDIYSDISYFVQSIVDYHNVIAISREYAAVTSKSLLQLCHIGPINSMKNETYSNSEQRIYTANKARKVRFLKKLSLISVYRNL